MREVTDPEQLKWTCVQAYGGIDDPQRAAELVSENGKVPVVCTPGGGAQSVRIDLPTDWLRAVSDAQLLAAIARAQAER